MIESDGVCSRDDFLCANDKCANASNVCDGKDDCGDNSDEGTVCSGNFNPIFLIFINNVKSITRILPLLFYNLGSLCSANVDSCRDETNDIGNFVPISQRNLIIL